jgi:hypothetical protein
MPYKQEKDMYPFVREWLQGFLIARHRKAKIEVFDTSRKSLARLIQDQNLMQNLPAEWPSWDIHVDVVGFIKEEKTANLAFVECKNTAIQLSHLSQLLGYSRVALPLYSFIVAPQGISDSLKSLLLTFNRLDILNYSYKPGQLSRSISVVKWDETANCIDSGSTISGDRGKIGRL